MRLMLVTVVAASSFMVACSTGHLTANERGIQEGIVRDRIAMWARHLNNQALDSLTQFYEQSPEFTAAWPDGTRASGWEEQRVLLRNRVRDLATLNLVVSDPHVRVLAWGVAVVTFRFSADLIFESADRDVFGGHGTQVWIRDSENTAWRLLVSQLSRTPAAAARI